MGRVILLLLGAAMCLAWSSLTVVRATNVPLWMLALLSTELGHYLAVLAWAWAVWSIGRAVRTREHRWCVVLAASILVVAGGLFLRPVTSGWRQMQVLPDRLSQVFPAGPREALHIDWQRLLLPRWGSRVVVESFVFTPADAPETLRLDFYRASRTGAVPCLVVIHGGGWDGGDAGQFSEWNHEWAQRRFAVAAIRYRLAPRYPWPAQREDTLAAIAWLKTHAHRLGLDPRRFVLLGRSAGGQIATAVGFGEEDPAIRGVIALYAPHDLHFVWSIAREDDVLNSVKLMRQYLGGPPDASRRHLYDSASAQLMVRPGRTPPTLLLHGALDELVWVEHSRRLAHRLQKANLPALLVELPWATHAFDYHRSGPGGQLTAAVVDHFLTAVTQPGDPEKGE